MVQTTSKPVTGYLALLASVLFLLAAWQHPDRRAIFLAVGLVLGIFAVQHLRR
jgi:hypothetical protein